METIGLDYKNYEITKLAVEHSTLANSIIFLVLALLIILSVRKKVTRFLDVNQTNQAKGIAILLNVIGHLWVHVVSNKPALIWSGEALSLFLILSGYGLSRSQLSPIRMAGMDVD